MLAALLVALALAAPCRSDHLRLAAGMYGEAGGEFVQTVTATNTGSEACALAGWPALRPAPSIRVVQGRPASHPFLAVVLRPGGAASFDVYGADFDTLDNRACPKTHAVHVAFPGGAPLAVAVTLPRCGPFYVAPFVSGRRDRVAWSAVWARRWCRMAQFEVTIGRKISEATGQHTLALRLANGGRSCTVYGNPTLSFRDARGRIPFALRTGPDQMIGATYALPVVVRHGGSAWVVINHYRCDLGDKRSASVIRLGIAGAGSVSVAIRDPYRRVSYCGPGDPGSTITIAPFEPTLLAAFQR